MGGKTGKLANFVTNHVIFKANLALLSLELRGKHANHGLGKTVLHHLADGGAQVLNFSSTTSFSLLSDGLSYNSETSHALELGATSSVINKIIELSHFKFNVVQTDDSFFKVVLLTHGLILVTAAGENGVDDEQWDPNNNENWVL